MKENRVIHAISKTCESDSILLPEILLINEAQTDNDRLRKLNLTNPAPRGATQHQKVKKMLKEKAGNDTVASIPFTHVDPSSGKFTAWTIQINDSEEAGRCE